MAEAASFDIAVIGGGSGLTAAYYAERDGKSVAVIDSKPGQLGGTCVNRGCIPTKGLVQAANVMRVVRDAARFGIELDQASVRADFGAIMRTVRERRAEGAEGVRSWVEGSMTTFYGEARFVGPKMIEIADGRRVTAEKIFIASGSRPAVPPIEGLDETPHHTNATLLELEEQPRSLVVIGGGYIGCEFSHFFSALGTEVTIVEPGGGLLANEDEDISRLFTEAFGERVGLRLGSEATCISREGDGVAVEIEKSGGERETLRGDAVLVAVGRSPNNTSLDLDRAGVECDEKGWIKVDDNLRTTNPDVFAYGDCIGRALFKHTSSYEGELAYRNAMGGSERVDYTVNPHAVFGEPEIGSVGLTERACRERGLAYRTATVKYAGIAKGQILGSPPGLAKAIVEEGTDRVLGFHLAGPHAAILIHEVVAVMSRGGTAEDIRRMIHVHPSMPELVQKVFTRLAG